MFFIVGPAIFWPFELALPTAACVWLALSDCTI